MALFFITGTSGCGKSTLKDSLRLYLPANLYAIYDFDENGVPQDADASWRQEMTDFWLSKSQENSKQNKSTVICGVSVPTEVINSKNKPDQPIYFGFLKIDDDLIRSRLQQRNWNDQLIYDNIAWANYLEIDVKKQNDHLIIDGTDCSPDEVASQVVTWINKYSNVN